MLLLGLLVVEAVVAVGEEEEVDLEDLDLFPFFLLGEDAAAAAKGIVVSAKTVALVVAPAIIAVESSLTKRFFLAAGSCCCCCCSNVSVSETLVDLLEVELRLLLLVFLDVVEDEDLVACVVRR